MRGRGTAVETASAFKPSKKLKSVFESSDYQAASYARKRFNMFHYIIILENVLRQNVEVHLDAICRMQKRRSDCSDPPSARMEMKSLTSHWQQRTRRVQVNTEVPNVLHLMYADRPDCSQTRWKLQQRNASSSEERRGINAEARKLCGRPRTGDHKLHLSLISCCNICCVYFFESSRSKCDLTLKGCACMRCPLRVYTSVCLICVLCVDQLSHVHTLVSANVRLPSSITKETSLLPGSREREKEVQHV